jgi:hypothetical protein
MVSSEEKLKISLFAGCLLWFLYILTSVFHKMRYNHLEVGLFAGFYAVLTRIVML